MRPPLLPCACCIMDTGTHPRNGRRQAAPLPRRALHRRLHPGRPGVMRMLAGTSSRPRSSSSRGRTTTPSRC